MRYTTIIDISEIEQVWHNENAVKLYLYMCLKCGYHNEDRDMLRISLRQLAIRARITYSAARHAMWLLKANELVEFTPPSEFKVTKFVMSEGIKARTQASETAEAAAHRKREERMQRLTEKLETLRRMYILHTREGISDGRDIEREAAKVKKELEKLQNEK